MNASKSEFMVLGLAAVAVLLIVKTVPAPASKAAKTSQPPSGFGAAGSAQGGLFFNLLDNNWTNDYANQASYPRASMGTDPLGLDNNPENDQGAAMSYAPWAVARVSPW